MIINIAYAFVPISLERALVLPSPLIVYCVNASPYIRLVFILYNIYHILYISNGFTFNVLIPDYAKWRNTYKGLNMF